MRIGSGTRRNLFSTELAAPWEKLRVWVGTSAAPCFVPRPEHQESSEGQKPHVGNEAFDRLKMGLNAPCIGSNQRSRYDKLYACRSHLPELSFRNPFLQRQKVFPWDTICLVQDLTPSILARRLHSEHPESSVRVGRVPVAVRRREQKVRSLSRIRHWLMFELGTFSQSLLNKHFTSVELK